MNPPPMGPAEEGSRAGTTAPPSEFTPGDESRSFAAWLLCAFAFLYLLTSTGRVRTIDEVLPVLQAESLVHHGTLAVPQAVAAKLFYGKLDRFGRPQAPYAPGFTLAVLPAYSLGQFLAVHLPGVPARARDLVGDFFTTASNAIYSAIAAALFFLTLRSSRISIKPALASTLLLGLATPLFAYSAWFFSEPLAAALLLGAALAFFGTPTDHPASFLRLLLGGALLGATLWVRPAHVIAAPVFLIALIVRDRRRGVRAAIVAGGIVVLFAAGYLGRNAMLFGNPFDFGYPEVAEGGKRLNTFETPLVTGLFGFLLSPGKSAFLFAPPVVLAIYGLRRLWRRDPGLATVATFTPMVYLLFYAKYTQWEGGYCFGPRYLVPVIGLLCLSLGPVLADASARLRNVAIFLGVAGLAVQCLGLGTSFLEDQATGRYYDAGWNYRLSYSPMVSQTKLLLHYLFHPAAPIGRGLDRWFLLLAKAQVSGAVIGVILVLEAVGLLVAVWGIRRSLQHTSFERPAEAGLKSVTP